MKRFVAIACLCVSWIPGLACAADPQPGQFCAHPAYPRSGDVQCFDTFQKAEKYLKLEPTAPAGFRFLQPSGPSQTFGNKTKYDYQVQIQPVERYVDDYFMTTSNSSPWPSASKQVAESSAPEKAGGCGPAPVLGTNWTGCDTEADANAGMLAVTCRVF